MASSDFSVTSCPTVANVSLSQITPLLAPSEAGQGDMAERCVSAAPEGPRPKEVRPGFDASGQSSRCFSEAFSKRTHPAEFSGQMSDPGPMGGSKETILRRERRKH